MEQQQRQLVAGRALADQPQLLGDRVVVVVAVDHDRVGQRDLRERLEAGAGGSARAPDAPASSIRPCCGAGRSRSRARRRRRPRRPAPASGHRRTRRPRRPTSPARRRGRAPSSSVICAIETPQPSGSLRYGSNSGNGLVTAGESREVAAARRAQPAVGSRIRAGPKRAPLPSGRVIIGRRFAWAHLPKTGGDATYAC